MLSSFSGRALAALLVLHGLAVLGYGSRASAGFWPTLVSPTLGAVAQGSGGTVASEVNTDQHSVWPPAATQAERLQIILQTRGAESGGGAGSPSTPSTSGLGPASALVVTPVDLMAAHPCSRLRIPDFPSGSNLFPTSIFEPPRVAG